MVTDVHTLKSEVRTQVDSRGRESCVGLPTISVCMVVSMVSLLPQGFGKVCDKTWSVM